MSQSVLNSYQYIVFDVDRTIAVNNEAISPSLIGRLRALIEHVNIVIITSRSIHEGLELLAQPFLQSQSANALYFFPTTAAQAYIYDVMTGRLLKLYDKAKGDTHYQQFHQSFRQSLVANNIELVDDLRYDSSGNDRKVQIHDRSAQVTLFFSYNQLREEYETVLKNFGVHAARHGRNTLHILPAGVDKRLAIDYLSANDVGRFLIFADGFYDDKKNNNYGNDLSLTEFPAELVTCINVGRHMPKIGSGVFYHPETTVHEVELTDLLLEKILAGCSFDDLGLTL